ncbi:MAG: UvrD-helicase domain-containing protein [Oscillospiraceae bacterium]|jgi:DNA helicase-2/ATP-dependent DNA helicase PcrA|nr:UvrD-helicase domain-containing protein [Oscillospiraceae bacterium]
MTDEFKNRFIELRRRAIALDYTDLNAEQQNAVLKTEGPLLILAGAGSGKTTVLIHRIANLLAYGCGSDSDEVPEDATEDDIKLLEAYIAEPDDILRVRVRRLLAVRPVDAWRIIAITFTNKAAGEMKTRLEKMLGESARDIWAMTFHSACARILRRDIDKLGYDTSFVIYDTADTLSLMKRIMKDENIDDKELPPRSVVSAISRAKDAEQSPDDFRADAEKRRNPRDKVIATLYDAYQTRLKQSNALDFDDLILKTVQLLVNSRETREYYQRKFEYVLVDEYQDTNNLQHKLASLLAGGHKNICVVGDDDQSIYKFRGATIENILGFEKHYPGATVIRLERNYRSTTHILDASNDVIARNRTRHGKTLWTDIAEGDLPTAHLADDERGEARFVAQTIIEQFAQGKKWSDHAVLYRMNAQSNNFEYEFKRNNIPYRVYGGTGFFDRAEVKDMTAYLCAVANPTDEVHLLRIINTPTRGIGQTTQDTALEIARATGLPFYDIIAQCRRFPELQKAEARLLQFVDMMEYLREMSAALPLDEFYDLLIEQTGVIRELEKKNSDDNLTRIENIRELKTNIVNFTRDNQGGTLADFLAEIALYTDLDKLNDNDDSVAMMTIHSAKGLEFDTVFIVGAEEGIFPGIRVTGDAAEEEEERRLCYVAMTRAKRRLFFIYAKQRMLFGKTGHNRLSRFVEEIADEHINKPAAQLFDEPWAAEPEAYGYSRAPSPRSGVTRPAVPKREKAAIPPPKKEIVLLFNVGDRVKHRAFGSGTVTGVTKTGGDALLDIDFADAGKKKLMMKTAAQFMEKQ